MFYNVDTSTLNYFTAGRFIAQHLTKQLGWDSLHRVKSLQLLSCCRKLQQGNQMHFLAYLNIGYDFSKHCHQC